MTAGNHTHDRPTAIVSTVASDSHTWNLVYLQLLLEEHGYAVTNLGACTPDDLLVRESRDRRPDVVVISTVNGHGHQDGRRVISALRGFPELSTTPVVIGGKLGVTGGEGHRYGDELLAAGFTRVYEEGVAGPAEFSGFLSEVATMQGVPA
ncbi:methylaspartate mutase [Paractinoplanes abujensis]|uniref:Methylaspartate mutase sigma subunit n=1 Tax=Paractinoplanes abujensis TaxID=882441 RepID=A0A7W7G2C3_9ACTN|nr:cobalamin B12-binding domain-containing protein [Actinoplanes abujensis]MBB4693040.1 methylaspartate mutase sigma subunit [Actinoplanes abujensis]GID24940.1 methylaspartate mutase [Actinoplanes abujensis]